MGCGSTIFEMRCSPGFPDSGSRSGGVGRIGLHARVVVSVTTRGVSVLDPLLGFLTSLLVLEQAWSGTEFLTVLVK